MHLLNLYKSSCHAQKNLYCFNSQPLFHIGPTACLHRYSYIVSFKVNKVQGERSYYCFGLSVHPTVRPSGCLSIRSFLPSIIQFSSDRTHESLGQFKDAWHWPILQGRRLIKGKVCHHNISTHTICITSILIPVMHMMKLKDKFKDWWLWPIF